MKKTVSILFASLALVGVGSSFAASKFTISNNVGADIKLAYQACYINANGSDCSSVQELSLADKTSQIINLASENQYYQILSSQAVGSNGKMITGEYDKHCEGKEGTVLVFDNFRTNTIACVEAHG